MLVVVCLPSALSRVWVSLEIKRGIVPWMMAPTRFSVSVVVKTFRACRLGHAFRCEYVFRLRDFGGSIRMIGGSFWLIPKMALSHCVFVLKSKVIILHCGSPQQLCIQYALSWRSTLEMNPWMNLRWLSPSVFPLHICISCVSGGNVTGSGCFDNFTLTDMKLWFWGMDLGVVLRFRFFIVFLQWVYDLPNSRAHDTGRTMRRIPLLDQSLGSFPWVCSLGGLTVPHAL